MERTGQCRLCLKDGPLRDSHFIPQAAYKLLRGKGKNPHPLVVSDEKVIQTSDQVRAHLLCHQCEQRLHKNGENTFFRNCYRGVGKFRLLKVLRQQKPLLEDEQFAVYAVPTSECAAVEETAYMGLSVLWKSAAHAWKDGDGTLPSISLGLPYQEQVRRFLLATGPFPEHAAMIVEVSDETNRLIAVVGTPASSKWPTHYLHWIDICGIRFNLVVGSRMPFRLKQLSVFRQGQKFVLLAKRQESTQATDYRHFLVALSEKRQR